MRRYNVDLYDGAGAVACRIGDLERNCIYRERLGVAELAYGSWSPAENPGMEQGSLVIQRIDCRCSVGGPVGAGGIRFDLRIR